MERKILAFYLNIYNITSGQAFLSGLSLGFDKDWEVLSIEMDAEHKPVIYCTADPKILKNEQVRIAIMKYKKGLIYNYIKYDYLGTFKMGYDRYFVFLDTTWSDSMWTEDEPITGKSYKKKNTYSDYYEDDFDPFQDDFPYNQYKEKIPKNIAQTKKEPDHPFIITEDI